MSTTLLYRAFGLVGYQYASQRFEGGRVTFHIEQPRERLRCPGCDSSEVWIQAHPTNACFVSCSPRILSLKKARSRKP